MDCFANPAAYEAADYCALARLSDQALALLPVAALKAAALWLDYEALQVDGLCGELTATLDLLSRFAAYAAAAGDVLTQVELEDQQRLATSDRRVMRDLAAALTHQQQRVQQELLRRHH
jgi:hypothetical protein